MAFGRRFGGGFSVAALRSARSHRYARPGTPTPPTRGGFRMRPGGTVGSVRFRRMARGGFFSKLVKKVGKVVKTVTHLPVIGAVAKTAIGSLPIVGQVQTAVNAFKRKTPAGAGHAAHATHPKDTQTTSFNQQANYTSTHTRSGRRKKPLKKAKRAKRAKRAKGAKRKGGGTAKQRAARARFAAAARRGRIRKGSRL